MLKIKKAIKDLKFPKSLSKILIINPNSIPFDLIARLKCYQCGLFRRAILCPPYLERTYPQFKSVESSKDFANNFKYALTFIYKNDGTKPWKINEEKLSHISFRKKYGKELKGTEVSQSRELAKLTKSHTLLLRKKGFKTFGLIAGHCDLCGFKCPQRDNPPCKKKGLPSLEAIGIDVYALLEKFNIKYEYPVENYLTTVTMILIR